MYVCMYVVIYVYRYINNRIVRACVGKCEYTQNESEPANDVYLRHLTINLTDSILTAKQFFFHLLQIFRTIFQFKDLSMIVM